MQYGAFDGHGQRVGNAIKSSAIGSDVNAAAIDRAIDEGKAYLKDAARRKAVGDRIRAAVAEVRAAGDTSREALCARLEQRGVSPVFLTNADGLVYGATFIDHNEKAVYKGSAFGPDLKASAFHKLFGEAPPVTVAQPALSPEPAPAPVPSPEHAPAIDPSPQRTPAPAENAVHRKDEYYANESWASGLDPFADLLGQGEVYEEIDPAFRLRKKKKKAPKRRR